MRRRWRSLKTMVWSRQSRRMLPIRRSTYGFCQGLRGALRTCSMPYTLDASLKALAVDRIAIPQQIPRSGIPREGLDDLLGRPLRSRICGDVEMDNPAPVTCQHEHDEEHLKTDRGHGEEIDRYKFRHVVLQERSPCRGGWFAVADAILLDRGFRNLNAEHAQFAQDAW